MLRLHSVRPVRSSCQPPESELVWRNCPTLDSYTRKPVTCTEWTLAASIGTVSRSALGSTTPRPAKRTPGFTSTKVTSVSLRSSSRLPPALSTPSSITTFKGPTTRSAGMTRSVLPATSRVKPSSPRLTRPLRFWFGSSGSEKRTSAYWRSSDSARTPVTRKASSAGTLTSPPPREETPMLPPFQRSRTTWSSSASRVTPCTAKSWLIPSSSCRQRISSPVPSCSALRMPSTASASAKSAVVIVPVRTRSSSSPDTASSPATSTSKL